MLRMRQVRAFHLVLILDISDQLPVRTHTLDFMFFYDAVQLPSVLWRCWLGGRKGIRPVKNWAVGVLAWLSVWSEVLTCMCPSWCHCHSLSLASVKSRLVLPFWYRLTIRYDTRCYFNVRSKADISQLNLPHGNWQLKKCKNRKKTKK